jgi:predicted peroxiredoxin
MLRLIAPVNGCAANRFITITPTAVAKKRVSSGVRVVVCGLSAQTAAAVSARVSAEDVIKGALRLLDAPSMAIYLICYN